MVGTIKLVRFFDLDSWSFLPVRIYVFHKLGKGFGEYFACVFRFEFRFKSLFGYWCVN